MVSTSKTSDIERQELKGNVIELEGDENNRRPQDPRLPLPGALLSRKWKGRTILVEA